MKIQPHIYLIFDKLKMEPYYVGKQSNQQNTYITGSTYLNRYIRMFGKEAFWNRFIRLILEYPSIDVVNEREEYYIKEYNTFKIRGNRTKGGMWDVKYRIPKKKPVEQYDIYGNFIRDWDSVTDPYKMGVVSSYDGVSACCRGKQKSSNGFIWKFKNSKDDIESYQRASYPKNRKRIRPIEIDNIKYISIQEVIEEMHISYYKLIELIKTNKIKHKWL